MKNTIKKIGVLLLFLAASCDLNKDLVNPNNVSVAGADANLIMNAVQLDFADFYYTAQSTVAPLVRQIAMTGGYRYNTAYQPQSQNTLWSQAYQNVLINAQTLIGIAADKGLTTHVGVAKVLQAYTYITLVDIFGDVPQSEALQAADGLFNPSIAGDKGSSVYDAAFTLLADARTELAKGGTLKRDIYFDGDNDAWIRLANTLELKMWLNISALPSRKAEALGKINALLSKDIIDKDSESFAYTYSATTVPNSRHPLYNQYYGPTVGQAGGYWGTGYMYELFRGKPDPTDPTDPTKYTNDPRWRYYFYRQTGSIKKIYAVDPKAIGCTPAAPPVHYSSGGYPFCVFDPGFYGRDHGDASGTPPDGPVMTCAGVYPAGGLPDNILDDNNSTFHGPTTRGDGADGAGILPIFMGSFGQYLKAEIMVRNGDNAGALTQLHSAIKESIQSVKSFADGLGQHVTRVPWSADDWKSGDGSPFDDLVETYLAAVDYLYANEADKLKIIGREYWVATICNGVEAYNSYRRTSGPTIMQPTLQVGAGPWLRSMIYPANYVNLNNTAVQKPNNQVVKVFWDGNPDTLN